MARLLQDSYERPRDDLPAQVASMQDPLAQAALVFWRLQRQQVITKAELAQQLVQTMDSDPPSDACVPSYIRKAIEHVCRDRPATSLSADS
jgi:hypothetical protein